MIFLLNLHKNRLRNKQPNKALKLKNKFSLETQKVKIIKLIIYNNELYRKKLIKFFLQKFVCKLDSMILKIDLFLLRKKY